MNTRVSPPTWFWVIAGLALLWNLMGVYAYIMQVTMSPAEMAVQYTQAEQDYLNSVPAWATGAFAIAVFAGVIGAVGLLLRKAWAHAAFVVSLLGAVVQNAYGYIIADAASIFSSSAIVMSILVLVILLFLIGFARKARTKRWIT